MELQQQSRGCHPLQVDNGKASKQLGLHLDSPGLNATIERIIICATATMEWFIQPTVLTQTLHVWSVFAGWLLWWHLPARKHNIARIAASSEGLRIVKAHGVWCQLSIRFSMFNPQVLHPYPNKSYTQRSSEMLFVPQSVHVGVYTAKHASCIIPTSLLFACLSRNVVKGSYMVVMASTVSLLCWSITWFDSSKCWKV